ncbi:putative inorganic phosphate cotransporter isoform X2 [Rhynchophorus ferrugineus]
MALLFFMLVFLFSMRTCISVGIVAMTTNDTSNNPDVPTYNWNNPDIILSSFFWSYAALQFFAGHLAQVFGTKWFLLATMFVNSLCSILIPLFADQFGANGVMFCRILQGLFQGFMLPLINNMLGRWVPPSEASLLSSMVFSGAYVGIIGSMIITGYFSASPLGWPYAFYFFGALGLIWCVFWLIFSAESPASHRTISNEEKKYIQHSLGQQSDHLLDTKTVPWRAIITSLPYWAIIVAAIGESWSNTLINSELPNYLSNGVGLNIQDSSIFSAVPLAVALVVSLLCGPIAGYTINKGIMSKVNSRRLFHAIASFVSAIGLVALSYIEDKTLVALILIITVGSGSTTVSSHLVNGIDIAPRYAGVLAGISNGCGQLVAILAPVLVHFVVTDKTDKQLWRIMFIVASIIIAATGTFFIVFCSGERQWWDDGKQNKKKSDAEPPAYGVTNKAFETEVTA